MPAPAEKHPFEPFLPSSARILFLGSFPPQEHRWCMPFYYPNWINDFWRIMGLIHFGDKLCKRPLFVATPYNTYFFVYKNVK